MHSDSDDNVGRVGADDGDAQAEIRVPSSAVRPHAEDKVESSEDEVVWKGRSTGQTTHLPTKRSTKSRTTPGATPSVDPASDHRARRSEATKNRMTTPSYSYPYSSGLYQPYAQPFWPHSPTYPLIYPPTYPLSYPSAYPRFYASPEPYKDADPMIQDGLSQQNTHHGETSKSRSRSVTFSPEIATMGEKPQKSSKIISEPTKEGRSKEKTKIRQKLSSPPSGPAHHKIDKVDSIKGEDTTILDYSDIHPSIVEEQSDDSTSHFMYEDPTPPSHSRGRAASVTPAHHEMVLYKDPRVSNIAEAAQEHMANPLYPLHYNAIHSEPLASRIEPHRFSLNPNDMDMMPLDLPFAIQEPGGLTRSPDSMPMTTLVDPLQTDRLQRPSRDPSLRSIDPEHAEGTQASYTTVEDMQRAANDMTVTESLSRKASQVDLADGRTSRRAKHHKLEGLIIAVTVQSNHATFYSQFSIPSQMKWPNHMSDVDNLRMDVKRAVSAKRLRRRDGSFSMELYCEEGPSSGKENQDHQMQWLHMQTHRLNLTDFENACLNAPDISSKTRFTMLRLFEQIRTKHQKQQFDGYCIEPGTVLRYDGMSSGTTDATQSSAIFMCFPYLSVGARQQTFKSPEDEYPTRSILQTLYPYESTALREETPSFCSDLHQALDQVLYVPQCWVVILNSDTVISCSELKLDNLIDESITISHHKKYFPPVTSHQGEVPIRVEDYLIDDDESDVSSMTGAFDSPVGDVETPLSGGTRDDTVQQFPSHSILNPALGPTIKESTISEDHPSAAGSPRTQVSFGSLQIAVPNDETHEKRLQSSSLTEEEAAEAEASILGVLDTLKSPHMTIEYLERFNTYITYVLTLWGRAPPGEQRRQFSVLSRLQDGLFRAEVLHGMCDIESQDSVFSSNLNYRDAMLKALGFVDSSVQKELESLGEVVMDAMTLFRGISDSNTRNAIRIAKKALRDQREVLKLETSERLPLSDSTSGSGVDNVKPFLTWVLVDAELDQKENTERVAAEYLHGMMREIEQSLLQRNEHSYDLCRELTISDLVYSLQASTPHRSPMTSSSVAPGHQRTPSRPAPWMATLQVLTSFGTMLENRPPEDPVLSAQKNMVRAAIDELFACLKRFVGLYVPCDYAHSVCYKLWGSMALLNNSATLVFKEEEHPRPLYIIRPLQTSFLRDRNIKKPMVPISSCLECKDGHTYKSHQEALTHLNKVHFRDGSLRHHQTARRYFVRTENDLRNERASKQHLWLLQICIQYFETLVTRGEKLHLGVAEGKQTDRRRYQLPDGLLDCFEETVLFLMQATTSVVAIRNEASIWKHTPGKAIDDLETPAVQSALEELGKLGESAQASMTRAEKAVVLAGGEGSTVSIGNAGPEFLVSIVLQNIARRHLLTDVKMDVNQLYQEYTSKLEYQIYQFPRKRLLRTIHKLQEELTVVQLVNSWQTKAFDNFLQILDPRTFKLPTSDRISLFLPESECISESLKSLQSKAVELEALKKRTQYLREQLKQSVEILEEDHGKAILMFTIITTIFLPLSFVTSLFGMNTSDIRNIDRTQAFFWVIAIPFTAVIVLVAILLAYRGDKLYDLVVQTIHEVKERHMKTGLPIAPLQDEREWGNLFSFARPSRALRSRSNVATNNIELNTLASSSASRSALVT
ncbi:hypothetical protein AA0116_g2953 [Alternaria tenuissima]|nr:hypothetical protein AA0115_g10906 [Alternaria tenuissima]RYO66172.1 hypothetical protein AA0116_g2953 [Alternaria tenuissima]